MTKAVLERVDVEIKRRRDQVVQIHEDLEDLEDYLDILQARRDAIGKPTYTQAEIKKRYAVE